MRRLHVLDLVEETLSLRRLRACFLGAFQFPIATQNQEEQHLNAEDNRGGGQRSSKILDALVLVFLAYPTVASIENARGRGHRARCGTRHIGRSTAIKRK